MSKWTQRFLDLAKHIASWSKDPSTQVGAVAINDDGILLSIGFNGFPRGVNDDQSRYNDRDIKLRLISHAEQNLIAQAAYSGQSLKGSTVILSGLFPCSACTKLLIQAGVKRVIAPEPSGNERWKEDAEWSETMLKESGVEVIYVV